MKIILSVMIVLGCTVSSLIFAAETVYKWTDQSGAVHFGDQPGHDAKAEEIIVTPSMSDDAGESEESEEEPAADDGAATIVPPKAERQAEEDKLQKKIREQNCQIARQTQQHNESIGRMYRVDANGERVFLSDEEREMVVNSSREGVEKWCD